MVLGSINGMNSTLPHASGASRLAGGSQSASTQSKPKTSLLISKYNIPTPKDQAVFTGLGNNIDIRA